MIQIKKGSTNNVALTLNEKCTLSTPDFLFVFQNDETRDSYTFVASDTSIYPGRYNLFAIIEKAAPTNPLAGEVNLPLVGFYTYVIYEQNNPTNLDPLLTSGVVEVGKVQVVEAPPSDSEFNNTNNINYIYNE